MEQQETTIFSYSDIIFSFFLNNDTVCSHKAVSHLLIYVYSGQMSIQENGQEITAGAGECVFVKRDHTVTINKGPAKGEQYRGITLKFNRNFLRDYYRSLDRKDIPKGAKPLAVSVLKLPESADIQSLFYPTLFDFTEPWKIDILDFLNKNYMHDLSMEEIALYTGRSLATFKRDFRKISSLSPQKWIMQKRLDVAYEKIRSGGEKISDVCFSVGFKNRSHFTTAFKKQFGFTPAR